MVTMWAQIQPQAGETIPKLWHVHWEQAMHQMCGIYLHYFFFTLHLPLQCVKESNAMTIVANRISKLLSADRCATCWALRQIYFLFIALNLLGRCFRSWQFTISAFKLPRCHLRENYCDGAWVNSYCVLSESNQAYFARTVKHLNFSTLADVASRWNR